MIIGSLPFQCRSCRQPLRLDRGSSRCIPCCYREGGQDCCHCDDKRHASTTYNGTILLAFHNKFSLKPKYANKIISNFQVNVTLSRVLFLNRKSEKSPPARSATRLSSSPSGSQFSSSSSPS